MLPGAKEVSLPNQGVYPAYANVSSEMLTRCNRDFYLAALKHQGRPEAFTADSQVWSNRAVMIFGRDFRHLQLVFLSK